MSNQNKRIEFETGLRLNSLFGRSTGKPFFEKGTKYFSRGRDALQCIINDLNLPPGTGVLLPAFSCDEVYRPFINAKYVPYYYKVNRDLTPDISHITTMAKFCKTIVVINYFGFIQPQAVYDELKDSGLIVIEDGSHSWFSEQSGSYGDYYFASLRKVMPLLDGAVLSKKYGVFNKSFSYVNSFNLYKFRFCRLMGMALKGSDNKRSRSFKQWLIKEFYSSAECLLSKIPVPAPMSSLSKRILEHLPISEIAAIRRRNYGLLVQELIKIADLLPVFPVLPEGTVPFGLPVFAEKRSLWQNALETLRIQAAPLWALSEMVPESVVDDKYIYANTVVLPVGQDYDENDILAMAERIKRLA